jgi:tetratricopeptide (TPR) repeat protein
MVVGIKLSPWLLPVVGGFLLMGLVGGFVVDAIGLNLTAVQNMNEQTGMIGDTEESTMLTDWGRCRQKHQIGREYMLADQYELALQPLAEAAACSNDRWTWFDLGAVQYALGDLEGAANSWQHTPEGYNQAVILAASMAEQDDLNALIAAWQFAADVNPNEQTPYIRLARLRATTEPEQVEPLLRQAIEANPNAPLAYIELGNYLLNNEALMDAQKQFEFALALDPSNIPLLESMAKNATELGAVSEAIGYWQEVALRNERRQGQAYYQIGNLAFADNNFSSALAFYKLAVEIEPENGLFLLGLAGVYVEAGCRQQAVTTYQKVLETAKAEAVLMEAELKLAELAVENNEIDPCPEEL